MAADTPFLYAAADEELLDAGRIVHTLKDTRTVGEMLHDADHLARHLLIDVTGDDAGHLLRGWPTLVDATSQLWKHSRVGGSTRLTVISPCSAWLRLPAPSLVSSRGLVAGPVTGPHTMASTRSVKR